MLGGFDPDGVSSGHVEGSTHYEGRAIDVFFRPVVGREPAARLAAGAVGGRARRAAGGRHRDLRPGDLDRVPLAAGLADLPLSRRRHGQPGAAARGPRARRRRRGRLRQRSGHGPWRPAPRRVRLRGCCGAGVGGCRRSACSGPPWWPARSPPRRSRRRRTSGRATGRDATSAAPSPSSTLPVVLLELLRALDADQRLLRHRRRDGAHDAGGRGARRGAGPRAGSRRPSRWLRPT